MTARTIAFFNNKGGVGKTTLVYHLAWMFSELGVRVIVVDLDPQSNLTSALLEDERIEELWAEEGSQTILGAIRPLVQRLGDIQRAHIEQRENIGIISGALELNEFEDRLSQAWSACLDDNAANAADGFRVMSAFHRVIQQASADFGAALALIDVGPNLGAINRAALVAADDVVVPLAPDLFSLRGLRNLGPKLREWNSGWAHRVRQSKGKIPKQMDLPGGLMRPLGYVVLQHAVRHEQPLKSFQRWLDRIPETYREAIQNTRPRLGRLTRDPEMLSSLKNYRSLMPLAHEARKPVFALRPADGAIGATATAALDAFRDFEALAREISRRIGLVLPDGE